MKKGKSEKALKISSEKFLKNLIEENEEVRIVLEISRLTKSTVKAPVPYNIDKTNYYKV